MHCKLETTFMALQFSQVSFICGGPPSPPGALGPPGPTFPINILHFWTTHPISFFGLPGPPGLPLKFEVDQVGTK